MVEVGEPVKVTKPPRLLLFGISTGLFLKIGIVNRLFPSRDCLRSTLYLQMDLQIGEVSL
jgi:hypothetical protein